MFEGTTARRIAKPAIKTGLRIKNFPVLADRARKAAQVARGARVGGLLARGVTMGTGVGLAVNIAAELLLSPTAQKAISKAFLPSPQPQTQPQKRPQSQPQKRPQPYVQPYPQTQPQNQPQNRPQSQPQPWPQTQPQPQGPPRIPPSIPPTAPPPQTIGWMVTQAQPVPDSRRPSESRPLEQGTPTADPAEPSRGNCNGPIQIVTTMTRAQLELRYMVKDPAAAA